MQKRGGLELGLFTVCATAGVSFWLRGFFSLRGWRDEVEEWTLFPDSLLLFWWESAGVFIMCWVNFGSTAKD